MKYERHVNQALGEEILSGVHESGLRVFIIPKKGFNKYYAVYGTEYGSIDTCFKAEGESKETHLPDGIAHFLEHKMFDEPDGSNAFDRFSLTGASANAYTGFDITAYLFSCTDKFYENLDILLSFVNSPYYTADSVDKEQGIIGQEIKMYDDDPHWRVFFNMLGGMYHSNPVKIDVGGSIESISQITPELLYKCHKQFYSPGNMILVMVGDVDPEIAEKYIDKNIKCENTLPCVKRVMPDEPPTIANSYVEQKLVVSRPLFFIGFKEKETGLSGRELFEKDIYTCAVLDILFGKSSSFYISLYEQGLIDSSFGKECELQKDYGFSAVSGESSDPKRVYELVLERVLEVQNAGITAEDANRVKKVMLGRRLRTFNDVENIGGEFIREFLNGMNPFDYNEIVQNTTTEHLNVRLREHFDINNTVLSVILSMGEDK